MGMNFAMLQPSLDLQIHLFAYILTVHNIVNANQYLTLCVFTGALSWPEELSDHSKEVPLYEAESTPLQADLRSHYLSFFVVR